MSDVATVRTWIHDGLKAGGLGGRGSTWRLLGSEVQWVVHLDELPYGNRLAVDIGVDLQIRSTPRLPTDCAILLHLENLPTTRDLGVSAALDMNSDLDETQRQLEIDVVIRALTRYVSEHLTLWSMRAAYKAGDLDSAFIHKDARVILEAEDNSRPD